MPENIDKRGPRIESGIEKEVEKKDFIMGLTHGEFNEWMDLRQELIPSSEGGREKMKRFIELEMKRIKETGKEVLEETEKELTEARKEAKSAFEGEEKE